MATYSKETALFRKDAIDADIQDAGTKATSFLSVDGTGVMVYDGQAGAQIPSNPNPATSNVLINPTVLKVRKGPVALAYFGTDNAQIGQDSSEHIKVTSNGIDFFKVISSTVKRIFRLGTVGQQATFESNGGYLVFDVDDNNKSGTIQAFAGTTRDAEAESGYSHVDNMSSFDINANSDNGCARVSLNSPYYARSVYQGVDPIVLNIRIGEDAFVPYIKLLEIAEDGNVLIGLNESATVGPDKVIYDAVRSLNWYDDVVV